MKHAFFAAGLALAALTLSSCTPVTVAAGLGAGAGIAAAQEGGIKTSFTDKAIHVKISDLWLKHSPEMYRKLNLNVKEGRVLVAGSVPDPDMRVAAVRLAWQAEGVRQVINEITVDGGGGVTGFARDSWIASNLKTQMVFDKQVQSINYNIEAVNGTVYLMGIAQDKQELDRVFTLARNTRGVKNVVSYVRQRGEQPVGALEPTSGPSGIYAAPPPSYQENNASAPPPAYDAPPAGNSIYTESIDGQPL